MIRNMFSLLLVCGMAVSSLRADDGQAVKAIQQVQGSQGTADARAAVQTLVAGGAKNLPVILDGFQDARPLAANWLRNAFDSIAAAEIAAGRALPADQLTAFILSRGHDPRARRLAYEWLLRQDETLAERIIPEMLEDPSPEFRRDAVARLITQAEATSGDPATELYQEAMKGAVDEDQVKSIAKALRDAGKAVDLPRHFGFLADWQVIGPFDNREGKGFAVAYEPESEVNLLATYKGQLGDVEWQPISTDDDFGVVDIGKQIENYKGSLMYATTTFESAKDQDVEVRLGTPNSWKLWVNGELVFEREEYHRGTRMDQYRVPVSLRAGENTFMLKVCQNEQEEDWAQDYLFQLRVCNSTGAGIVSAGDNNE